ncbi:hypothetical protein ACFQJC_10315 [Haloferax namakaokahaiae]|uniref:Flagellin n=1 Tax=Haloferax namakaokahaiae TaxID=1748331 RepID=A0ABD5ZFD4_9EURY
MSEVIGFVLVFALIVSSISVFYITGNTALTSLKDDEQINNGDRAFIAMAENMNDLLNARGPQREGEIKLAGGTMSFNDTSALSLKIEAGGTTIGPQSVSTGSLVYQLNDEAIWYESGGVFRESSVWSTMKREPGLLCTPSHAIISTVSLSLETNATSVSREGTVLIVGRRAGTNVVYPATGFEDSGMKNATLTVTSQNDDAWEEYLTETGWDKTGTNQYSCTAENMLVRESLVQVKIL